MPIIGLVLKEQGGLHAYERRNIEGDGIGGSILTAKLGLAMRGVQRHEIGVEGTLEINATLREEEGKLSLGANSACCNAISESVGE